VNKGYFFSRRQGNTFAGTRSEHETAFLMFDMAGVAYTGEIETLPLPSLPPHFYPSHTRFTKSFAPLA